MAPTNQELADLARTALSEILTKKVASHSIAGRTFTMQNVSELVDLIVQLEKGTRQPKVRGATPSW